MIARNHATELDRMLNEVALTRADVARAFGISRQRVSQIFNGCGVSYLLADDLRRYINRAVGGTVCRNEHFIAHRKEKQKRR